jgi:hypothetical protein
MLIIRLVSLILLMLGPLTAQALRNCTSLPMNSSAYFACESLNIQERAEDDRKKQERERYQEQLLRRSDELLEQTRKALKRAFDEEKLEMAKNKNVPEISDYGTDITSLNKFTSDIDETSIDACQAAWNEKKSADAAFCLARHESGRTPVAISGADQKSLTKLKEAAMLGHPLAQNNWAMEISHGNVAGNSAEIAKLIRASANSGIPHAQVTVGWWHMTGDHGFKVDHAEAMKWNLRAYKQGHSEGANNIGELYEKGLGVPKDMEQAKSWYKKASVLGNAEATERLKKMR